MIEIESSAVYGIVAGEVVYSTRAITFSEDEIVTDLQDAMRPLTVEGVSSGDFAVFLEMRDKDGGSIDSVGYLVTHQEGDTATIVPEKKIDADPRTYGSQELLGRLMRIPTDEIGQFALEALVTRLYRHHR